MSERQWGMVREDYSDDGNAWDYFTHDKARSRAYRWPRFREGGLRKDEESGETRFNISAYNLGIMGYKTLKLYSI